MLLYFVLGMLCYALILPIIEAFGVVLTTAFEVWKGQLSVKIAEYNMKIQQIKKEDEQPSMNTIGFIIPETDEIEDDDE